MGFIAICAVVRYAETVGYDLIARDSSDDAATIPSCYTKSDLIKIKKNTECRIASDRLYKKKL